MKNLYSANLIDNLKKKMKIQKIIMIVLLAIMILFDTISFIKVDYYNYKLIAFLTITVSTIIIFYIIAQLVLFKYYKNDIMHIEDMLNHKIEKVRGIIDYINNSFTTENDRECYSITVKEEDKIREYYLEKSVANLDFDLNEGYLLYIVDRYIVYYEKDI